MMSFVARFHPTGMTTEQYEEANRQLEGAGVWPPDGLDYHVCFGQDGDLRVSEIWDSQEKFEAFGEKLMPILAEVGIQPGAPEILEVHKIVKR
jgi:hypothetical protein